MKTMNKILFMPNQPKLIDEVLRPKVIEMVEDNVHLISIKNKFLESFTVFGPINGGADEWFCIANAKLRVLPYTYDRIVIRSIESVNAKFD